MIAKFNIPAVMDQVKARSEKALTVIGAAAVSHVTAQIRKNKSIVTANLINSITYSSKDGDGEFGTAKDGKTDGKNLTKGEDQTVRIGTTVVYAPRVEFGFVGKDSLERNINQAPKSFLRVGLKNNKKKLKNLYALMMKGSNSG